MGNTNDKNSNNLNQLDKFPHFKENCNDSIVLQDESPDYRYDFYDRNKQLLEFHIMNQSKCYLLTRIHDCKKIFKIIFNFVNIKDLFNLSLTCRLIYNYWTRDDEVWRIILPQYYKNLILNSQPLSFSIYGIKSWKDVCKNIYCKEMWKRLHLKYQFINGSMCSNSTNSESDEEEGDDDFLNANSSMKCHQSKKSDKSSNQIIQNSIEELRIHFICNEKKQTRYLKTILKNCKEPKDTNYRLSKKFSSFFDRRVARIKEITNNGNSNNGNSNNGNEYEIQCLVGSSLRPNCACKFILIDLSENLNLNINLNNQDLIREYLKIDLDCGETIKEYLNTTTTADNNLNNLSIVIVGLSYERKSKINLNTLHLCKTLSNEYSLPYIEIDIGKRNQRRDLLYFYSIYCHSKKMTSDQLTFLKTNNTNNEWLL